MTDNISVREACRRRQAIGGADAQALEGALSMTESERDDARAQLAAEKARADQMSDLYNSAANAQQNAIARAETIDENLVTAIESLRTAERSRDELGIQLAAQSERLRLAMDAVKKLKTFRDSIAFNADGTRIRVINSIDICAMWDESNDAVAALDAVPGDALARDIGHPLDRAHEASGVVTQKDGGK